MEKLNIKDLNLSDFENNLESLFDDKERVSFIDDFVQTIFKSSEHKTYKNFLVAVHLNARDFCDMYGMIATFIRRNKLRDSEIGKMFDNYQTRNTIILDLNKDPEQSVFEEYKFPEDLDFVKDILDSLTAKIMNEKGMVKLSDLMQLIIDNPLPEVSNWSVLSAVLTISLQDVIQPMFPSEKTSQSDSDPFDDDNDDEE